MITYFVISSLKKKFIKGIKKTGGRSNTGRVTVRGRGGGNKINYRILDLYRRLNQYGMLMQVFYDPNRTCKLGLIIFENGLSNLILAQVNMRIRDVIYLGSDLIEEEKEIKNGYSMPLINMPLYSVLSNIE